MSEYAAINTFGQTGRLWAVGSPVWGMHDQTSVISITSIYKCGQMAEVQWFLVVTEAKTVFEVNGAFVEWAQEATDE